jgi:hypothetical protein
VVGGVLLNEFAVGVKQDTILIFDQHFNCPNAINSVAKTQKQMVDFPERIERLDDKKAFQKVNTPSNSLIDPSNLFHNTHLITPQKQGRD